MFFGVVVCGAKIGGGTGQAFRMSGLTMIPCGLFWKIWSSHNTFTHPNAQSAYYTGAFTNYAKINIYTSWHFQEIRPIIAIAFILLARSLLIPSF